MTESSSNDALIQSANSFIRQFYQESDLENAAARLSEIEAEIRDSGSYSHTPDELLFGAKLAWRNSNRCIGRLFYDTLELLDHRDLSHPDDIFSAIVSYLDYATNGGRIRPAICVFKPKHPRISEQITIWNNKLIRYAGYNHSSGTIGDPEEITFTKQCEKLGWKGTGTSFDLLPVVIEAPGFEPKWYSLPEKSCLEVPIIHPEFDWFNEFGLRWYAVPVISNMILEIGGIHYTAAPFNGWFMSTEIGSRNLGDHARYNMLPKIAQKMGLDQHNRSVLWQDRAMIELNTAVIFSFKEKGVTLVDHHTASRQFMRFNEQEKDKQREVFADWSWIVPPMSGSATEVFFQHWDNKVLSPNFYYRNPVWNNDDIISEDEVSHKKSGCPFHISSLKTN
jgi:nitric-oxide synthase